MDRAAGLTAAALVGDRFDLLKEAAGQVSARLTGHGVDPLEPLATALWGAIRVLSRDGAPDRFRASVEGAMGSARAFADAVLEPEPEWTADTLKQALREQGMTQVTALRTTGCVSIEQLAADPAKVAELLAPADEAQPTFSYATGEEPF
jgi:hypothetical protein